MPLFAGQDELEAALEQPLTHAAQIRSQYQRQRGYAGHSLTPTFNGL
jgi:hypothetical protein